MSSLENIVLTIENVAHFSRPPLDKLLGYFPSDAEACVVGRNQTGRDSEKWLVVATKAGYTFKNMGTDLYLAISTESGKEGRLLQAAVNPYYWWINPASSQPVTSAPYFLEECRRASAHQSQIQVIAGENSQAACQLWLLNDQMAKDPPVKTKVPKVPKAERTLRREAAETVLRAEQERRRLEGGYW
ncbi:hypothetical protein B0H14DRAFT_2586399 [Mycena olivaceomarginata]|nr:hypothetical protein B0H14DRAFT_2586399 [Mycena olivaceomarginata]